MSRAGRPRVLLVSMYRLDGDVYGPISRIMQLRDALARRVDLEVISGLRLDRSSQMARYVARGRLRGLDGIYVEASTNLPGPVDVMLLALSRALRIRSLTFIRDAYPLFPEYALTGGLKHWLANRLFLSSFRALMAASTSVAFPSRGLAVALGHDRPALLPPASPPAVDMPRRPDASQLLHVGGLNHPELGAGILFGAIERLRSAGRQISLTLVAHPAQEPPRPHPEWLRIVRGSGTAIHRLLPDVVASVIPRRRGAYNDLAVPTKLMEYLSYGRPLIVTDCTETAAVVRSTQAGLVAEDSVEGLAAAIESLLDSEPAVLDRYSAAARAAAGAHSWDRRAQDVLELLNI